MDVYKEKKCNENVEIREQRVFFWWWLITQNKNYIIFYTGFKHHFSYELKLMDITNILFLDDLHKGVFLENNPKIIFMGIQISIIRSPYFRFKLGTFEIT